MSVQRDIDHIARQYCRLARTRRRMVIARAATALPKVIDDPRAQFAREVIDRLDGPILRQSKRDELMRIASDLHIGRFDACLIIAQVQHQAEIAPVVEVAPAADGTRFALIHALGVALLTQGAIIAAILAIAVGAL
jgi:hypothetical protein